MNLGHFQVPSSVGTPPRNACHACSRPCFLTAGALKPKPFSIMLPPWVWLLELATPGALLPGLRLPSLAAWAFYIHCFALAHLLSWRTRSQLRMPNMGCTKKWLGHLSGAPPYWNTPWDYALRPCHRWIGNPWDSTISGWNTQPSGGSGLLPKGLATHVVGPLPATTPAGTPWRRGPSTPNLWAAFLPTRWTCAV
jgi:hypothetical protein